MLRLWLSHLIYLIFYRYIYSSPATSPEPIQALWTLSAINQVVYSLSSLTIHLKITVLFLSSGFDGP